MSKAAFQFNDSIDAYRSDEFRSFAIKWLGFDPLNTDLAVHSCTVHFSGGGKEKSPVEYTLKIMGRSK